MPRTERAKPLELSFSCAMSGFVTIPPMPKQILVTAALPYVNGHIHIGHLVEYIQADVWVRFQRMLGHTVAYICADDVHGTATMIRARQEGRTEQQIMAEMSAAHQQDFADFGVEFTHYGSTDSPANQGFVHTIWAALKKSGHVAERDVTQLYDPKAGSFLADRFVKGRCPKCDAPDQYGDSCDKCFATFSPTDLKDAVSTLSGAKPELRSARHWFVQLENHHAFLEAWTQQPGHIQGEIANWLKGTFLNGPLRDWDVSRPAPYFGFEIPGAPGNYFYVWVDAPVGYIGSTKDWCDKTGQDWRAWWPMQGDARFSDESLEIHHFIGKDITYFHALFWPAMLNTAGFRLPDSLHIHGWLTVNGEKMSKSKGTFIRARSYLDAGLDPAYLRYYYASKLGASWDDLDLNLDEFIAKVNSDVVGKLVNLASRTAKFVPALAASYPEDGGLFLRAAEESAAIAADFSACRFSEAVRRIMALADRANEFVETRAPWALKKDPAKAAELAEVCTVALNLFRQLCVYLAPVLPGLAVEAGKLLGAPITCWDDAQRPVTGHAIAPFQHLAQRVDKAKVDIMVAASTEQMPPLAAVVAAPVESIAPTITIDDFSKIDLRVALVVAAEEVPKAKKVLKLTVDVGEARPRTIFAGIKAAYDPAKLIGRHIVVVANLAPRQMSFGLSEGMALAAGTEGADLFVISPDAGAKPGQRVK